MKNTHHEHDYLYDHFDESISNFGGRPVGRPMGVRPMGGASLTPQQRHLNMVRRFYRHNPQPIRFNRSFRVSPLALRWMGGGGEGFAGARGLGKLSGCAGDWVSGGGRVGEGKVGEE